MDLSTHCHLGYPFWYSDDSCQVGALMTRTENFFWVPKEGEPALGYHFIVETQPLSSQSLHCNF